jgi:hypothetical protein
MNTEPTRCPVSTVARQIAELEAAQRIADETFEHAENDRLNSALHCLREPATHLVPQSMEGMRFLVDLIGLYSEFAGDELDDESRAHILSAIDRMTDSVARFAVYPTAA